MKSASRAMGWWRGRPGLAAVLTSGAICALVAPFATGSANAATSAGPPPVTILTHGANNGNAGAGLL